MRVSKLLATKGHEVATISQDRSVADALVMLKERGIGALLVSAPDKPLAGIFSERDVVRALVTSGESTLQMRVADLMSSELTVCDETTLVTDLMGMMTAKRIRHVPVVNDGEVVGLVSIGDIVKARFDELADEKRDLLDYMTAR
jgi:CBS domain-containing protein